MPKRALSLLSVILALATPALVRAAEQPEAWTPDADSLRANASGITLPQNVGDLSLSKSGEMSNGGKGVDNYAQYLSEDGVIQATLYVYLPSYADASLAAYMTDKAIMERFGPKTRRTAYDAVPLAGQSDRAIRTVYDDAADGALTTAAAFVHAGKWLVKLRVTGPAQRRKEVLSGLDGMLSGLRFDEPQDVHPTSPAHFSACPTPDVVDARLTPREDTAALDIALPREGTSLCVRGRVQTADGNYEMLQQPGSADGSVIVPIDDAGTILTFDPASAGGYQMSIHSIGQTQLFGVYDKVPSPRQIAEILDGKDPQTAQARTTANYAANGEVTTRHANVEAR